MDTGYSIEDLPEVIDDNRGNLQAARLDVDDIVEYIFFLIPGMRITPPKKRLRTTDPYNCKD